MFCDKCGAPINDGIKFCNNCGAAQTPVSKPMENNNNSNAMNASANNTGTANSTNGMYTGKCQKCGYQGEMVPGPYLRMREIVIIVLCVLSPFIPAGLTLLPFFVIYLIVMLVMRKDPDKREKVCQRCNSKNITYK